MKFPPLATLLIGSLLLAACGGGGGGDGAVDRVRPVHQLDVRIYESLTGTVENSGIVRHDIQCAGDLSDNTTRRAFYTFIVDDLPAGALVESAIFTTLRLRHRFQTNIDGARDYCAFSSPAWEESHRRVSLIVTYTLP